MSQHGFESLDNQLEWRKKADEMKLRMQPFNEGEYAHALIPWQVLLNSYMVRTGSDLLTAVKEQCDKLDEKNAPYPDILFVAAYELGSDNDYTTKIGK